VHNTHNEVQSCIKSATNEIQPHTLEWSYLMLALSRLKGIDVPENLLPPLHKEQPNVENFNSRFQAALKMAVERHPQYRDKLNLLSKHVQKATAAQQKESFKGQRAIEELINTDLNSAQQRDLLSIFEVQGGASDAILNDALNAHPIAAKLLGDRLENFFGEYVSYSQTYKEGTETLFPDVNSNPIFANGWKKDPHFESPTPNHPPFNSPLDQVYQWKLEKLAQIFNFDLKTPVGLSQFDIFIHSYDLSPGELSLERVHSYPAFYHTYEELPILKHDGYDPFEELSTETKTALTISQKEVDDLVKLIPASKK